MIRSVSLAGGQAKRHLVVGLGEALFDCFPHSVVLGGAPVNVAVHAAAMLADHGGRAATATRVGRDDLGSRFVSELSERGLETAYVQSDSTRSTGRVHVSLNGSGDARYDFEADAAWDALEMTADWRRLAEDCTAVAFGTLGQRSADSAATIAAFLSYASRALRLFDVNLRGDFYSAETIRRSMGLATAVKLNDAELDEVYRLLSPSGGASTADDRARAILSEFRLDWLALTRGAAGVVLYTPEKRLVQAPPLRWDPDPDADTVGAGDACCAGLLVGSVLGLPPEQALWLGAAAGSFVASRHGATPELPAEVCQFQKAAATP